MTETSLRHAAGSFVFQRSGEICNHLGAFHHDPVHVLKVIAAARWRYMVIDNRSPSIANAAPCLAGQVQLDFAEIAFKGAQIALSKQAPMASGNSAPTAQVIK
jgi:hypothetical protein